ncbi:MAG: hypothetical protein KatS3mg109_1674 [Pirellulaceae bacterium]|nr:MAG: hypothetical protein KatS3mg109_1674 [Pirellulaceae bacterium]GIW92645.1 MAG: hypothetical protein KatS3mg110_0686 [Pirellulaceae bacterium]
MLDAIPSWVLLVVVLAGALVAAVFFLSKRRRPKAKAPEPPRLDMSALSTETPRSDELHLECYGIPVRVAAVVIAPLGRDAILPDDEQIGALFDQLVPGLAEVIAQDRPQLLRWPAQLSRDGFVHAFFNQTGITTNVSPWCAVAGRVLFHRQQLAVGLVARTAQPTRLGRKTIEHEGQWATSLRVCRPERRSS